jgi:hypothetical protein
MEKNTATTANAATTRDFLLTLFRSLPLLFVGDSEWSGSLRFIMVFWTTCTCTLTSMESDDCFFISVAVRFADYSVILFIPEFGGLKKRND